jgi:PAS domain-containing protein
MKKEPIDKDLILSLTNEMKLAGVPAFPFSAEYKELYSCLFSCLNLPLLIIEPQTGRILDANPAAGALFNCTSDALRLTTVNILFAEPGLDSLFKELQLNKNFPTRLKLKHIQYENGYAETFAGYIKIKGKKVIYLCIENYKSESGFTDKKPPVQVLTHKIDEAIVLTDSSGRILNVNDTFTQIFGYSENEIEGKPINSFLPGVCVPLETNRNEYPLLLKVPKKDGAFIYVETGPDCNFELSKNPESYSFYIREILPEDIIKNEILWLSNMLENSNETNIQGHLNRYKSIISQGNYTSNEAGSHFNNITIPAIDAARANELLKVKDISHEFRTLMNIIMGFTEILKTELSNKDHVEMINYIADSNMKIMAISKIVLKMMQEHLKQNIE